MKNILDFTREELVQWLDSQGMRPFRAGQIFKWLYLKNVDTFDQMTDLSKDTRVLLESHFVIRRLDRVRAQVSADTTRKFLFGLQDGQHIESVLIPEKDHFTLCVSSQAGCAMNCAFCLTAKGGLVRNLTLAEITSQVRDVRKLLMDEGMDPLRLSNLVFMGMGEPLANYDTLIRALSTLTDTDFGFKFSPRRVTVSTCGLVPKIIRLGQDTTVNLAISLNAVTHEKRSELMPVNKKYPLADLLAACRQFQMKPRNKITFEYILIKGVSDSLADAQKLVTCLKGIRAKVNLIPFNEHEKSAFRRPSKAACESFLQVLLDAGLTAITRKSKGDDISAACGQLSADPDIA